MISNDQKTALKNHKPGGEPAKSHERRVMSGLLERYLSGECILDIGAGQFAPVVPWATTIDLDYPGYDGTHLPFADESIDGIFSSHCLEHVTDAEAALKDWFRTLRVGAHLFIAVPHMYLYERQARPPSTWNVEHLRFFTPGSLLTMVEKALPPNSYRVRMLSDNDNGYDYSSPLDEHPHGCYEIELVIEKIQQPEWPDIWGYRLLEDMTIRRPNKLAICGAGQIGEYIYQLVTEHGYEVSRWTDKEKAGQTVLGCTITTLADALSDGCTDFVITAIRGSDAIAREISNHSKEKNRDIRIYQIAQPRKTNLIKEPIESDTDIPTIRIPPYPIENTPTPHPTSCTIIVPTVYGQMLVNRYDINQSNALIKTGAAHDLEQIRMANFLCDRAPNNSVMLDIGANFGTYSVSCAQHLKSSGGRVYAFEGQRMLAYMLCGTAAINDLENLFVHHACVGNDDRDIDIPKFDYHKPMNFGSVEFGPIQNESLHQERQPSRERVKQIKIDDMQFDGVFFVKIDVEGMECEVLAGAASTFKNERPITLIEYIKSDAREIAKFFRDLNYEIWKWGTDFLCVPSEKLYILSKHLPKT